MLDSYNVVVIDVRNSPIPVYSLSGHNNCVNALAWSPADGNHLITGADDHQALIWEVHHSQNNIDPRSVYNADSEINNLVWSTVENEWIAISKNKEISVLRI